MVYDMHCHLGFASDAEDALRGASGNIAAFSATVMPAEYDAARRRFSEFPHVKVGIGMHPWFVRDESEVRMFEKRVPSCPFVGEIGLDFSPKRLAERGFQEEAFERAVRACAASGDRIGGGLVSLHAVASVDEVLDALARVDACGSKGSAASLGGRAVALHSFGGTSDQLNRAVRAGLFFSCGPRMLRTKRGRAYVRSIPADRLMVETDMPSHDGGFLSYEEWSGVLGATYDAVLRARLGDAYDAGEAEEFAACLRETSARLLGV